MKAVSKSIEQLENDFWDDQIEFASSLVLSCHKYRKIPINELTIEQLRLLISQEIGIQYLIPLAIEKLDENALSEGDLYEGDLLDVISRIPINYWTEKQNELQTLFRIVELNSKNISAVMGDNQFNQIRERINVIAQQLL